MKSLSLSKPHLIATVGLPGSGKSFFADKFADTFHAPLVSRDKTVQLLKQSSPTIDAVLFNQVSELLKTQQTVIVDGLADTRADRAELAKIAKQGKYTVLLVWVQTDPATAKARATHTPAKGESRRMLSPGEFDVLVKRFAAPTAIDKPVVVSGKHTFATQAKVVLKKLSEPRAAISMHTQPPVRPTTSARGTSITIR